jgi:hypothetical protein
MEKIRDIAKQYQLIQKNKKSHAWYTNVYENIKHTLLCIDFVEKHHETAEAVVEAYAANAQKSPAFLREWLLYGLQHITQCLHSPYLNMIPDAKELWPMFFEQTTFEHYDISYYSAQDTLNKMNDKLQMHHCKDENILAIHKGKQCDCMYMCSYCDEMELRWKKKVHDMFSSPHHILLRPALQATFVEKWLVVNKTYSAYKWPPTKVYYDSCYDYGLIGHNKTVITDFADMCAHVKETRKKYKQGGKTPLQCHDELSYDLQALFNYIQPAQSDISIFIKLWNKIDLVPLWINYDKARCKEILNML